MKKIIIDLKEVKKLGQVWNRFAIPFNFPNAKVEYDERELLDGISWDAFWDYFNHSLPSDENKEESLHLIVKNISYLRKISERDYNLLLKCLEDAIHLKQCPGTCFTYKLIEDSSINSNKQK